jgi:hypothetical protein
VQVQAHMPNPVFAALSMAGCAVGVCTAACMPASVPVNTFTCVRGHIIAACKSKLCSLLIICSSSVMPPVRPHPCNDYVDQ